MVACGLCYLPLRHFLRAPRLTHAAGCAEQVRERIIARAGGPALAHRLVPVGPREDLLLARARLLSEALGERISTGAPLLQVRPSGFSVDKP